MSLNFGWNTCPRLQNTVDLFLAKIVENMICQQDQTLAICFNLQKGFEEQDCFIL
mgnify:CR=1 FL=1